MTTQILKTVFAGMLASLALFLLPFFLLRVFFFFLIVGAIVKLLGGRRRGTFRGMYPAFANRFASMSEEEKINYKEKFGKHCHRWTAETNKPTINQ